MTMDRDPMTTLRDWLDDRAATAGSSEASFRETMRLVRHTPQGRRARILQAMRGHTGRESSRPAFQVGAVAIVVASAGLALAMALGWSASGDREPHGEPASPSPIPTEATAEPALPSIDRSLHTAETLDDGSVLLIGGAADSAPSLQRFDPTTGRLSDTGELTMPRSEHASVLLGDGRVLIVGGYGTDGSRPVAEWFDPATGTSTADAGIDLAMTRPTASLLDDGRILRPAPLNSSSR
jgi:hypothetical protein